MVDRTAGDRRHRNPGRRAKACGRVAARARELTQWENWNVPALGRLRRHGRGFARASSSVAHRRSRPRSFARVWSMTSISSGSTASRWAVATVKTQRVYDVPAQAAARPATTSIVVNVFDMWGSGGMHGPASERALRFADGTCVPLGGLGIPAAAARTCRRCRARPGNRYSGINILYNGMIAPLGKFGLRGVAWYQGEANAGLDDAQTLPGAARGAVHGLAPPVRLRRCRSSWCSSRTGMRSRRRRWTAAGRKSARCAAARGGRRWQRRASR